MDYMLNHIKSQIRLEKGQFYRLGLGGGRVVKGEAWVTVAGFPQDLILRSGEALPCCAPGVLVEALSAELVLETSASERFSLRKTG